MEAEEIPEPLEMWRSLGESLTLEVQNLGCLPFLGVGVGMGGVVEVLFGMVWLPFTLFFVSSLCASLHSNGFSSKSDKWVLSGSDMYMFCLEYRAVVIFDEIVGSILYFYILLHILNSY